MAYVYSLRIAEQTAATAGTTPLYTVPSAKTLIVRDICALCESAGTNVAGVLRTGGPFVAFWSSAAANTFFERKGRMVFNAGDFLNLDVGSGTWQVSLSGYLLDD